MRAESEDKGPTRSELEWYYYTKGGGSPHRYLAHCLLECGSKTRAPSKICSRCKKTSLKSFTLKKLQTMAEAFGLKKPSTKKVAIKRIKGWLEKQPTIRPAGFWGKGLSKTGISGGQITEDEIVISRANTHYVYAFHRDDDRGPDEYTAFIVTYHNNGTFTFSLADMSMDSSLESSITETVTTDPYVVIHNNMEFTPRLPEVDSNLDYGDNIISFGPQSLKPERPGGRPWTDGEYIPSPIAESIKEMGVDIYLQNPITGDILKFFTVYFTELLLTGQFHIDVVATILDVEDGKYELSAVNRPSGWRAESEVVSGKKKGKVISLIGSDPRLRKLKKDKDITPEEAATRLEISAEPNYNYNIGPYDGQEEQTPREFGAEGIRETEYTAGGDYKWLKGVHPDGAYFTIVNSGRGAPYAWLHEDRYSWNRSKADRKLPLRRESRDDWEAKCEYCPSYHRFPDAWCMFCASGYGCHCECDDYYAEEFGAETKVEAIQECLFCPESEGLVEIDIEGYPEYICEYCLDPTNWGEEEGWEAENWSGDPDGILAKALAKARDKMKERKSLNITKLPDPNQKTLDEFNGAVVWKEPKGIVEKVMVREMAMQQLALSEAILELEQYIRLGMISEEEAFRKIVAMSQ